MPSTDTSSLPIQLSTPRFFQSSHHYPDDSSGKLGTGILRMSSSTSTSALLLPGTQSRKPRKSEKKKKTLRVRAEGRWQCRGSCGDWRQLGSFGRHVIYFPFNGSRLIVFFFFNRGRPRTGLGPDPHGPSWIRRSVLGTTLADTPPVLPVRGLVHDLRV